MHGSSRFKQSKKHARFRLFALALSFPARLKTTHAAARSLTRGSRFDKIPAEAGVFQKRTLSTIQLTEARSKCPKTATFRENRETGWPSVRGQLPVVGRRRLSASLRSDQRVN